MRSTNRGELLRLIAAHRWTRIGESERAVLLESIPNLSASDLKRSPIPVEPPWRGVDQRSLDVLESSLRAFSEIYAGQPGLRAFCRTEVIRAKDHARLASRNRRVSDDKRRTKSEMVEWMLVWLDDPALFPTWVELRRRELETNMLPLSR